MYNVNDYGILFMHAPVVSINGLIFPGNIGRQLTGAATTLLGGASGPFFGLTTVNVYNKKSGRWFHQLPPIKKEKKHGKWTLLRNKISPDFAFGIVVTTIIPLMLWGCKLVAFGFLR